MYIIINMGRKGNNKNKKICRKGNEFEKMSAQDVCFVSLQLKREQIVPRLM